MVDKKNQKHKIFLVFVLQALLFFGCASNENVVNIYSELDSPQVQFAIDELAIVFKEKHINVVFSNSEDADIQLRFSQKIEI